MIVVGKTIEEAFSEIGELEEIRLNPQESVGNEYSARSIVCNCYI